MSPIDRTPNDLLNEIDKLKNKITRLEKIQIETQQEQQAILNREKFYRTITNNASDVITIVDKNGIIIYESPSCKTIFGYNPEELIGQNGFAYFHPDDMPIAQRALQSLLNINDGESYLIELRFLHKNGSWRYVEGLGKNFLHDPIIKGILINVRDITEKIHVRENLIQTQAQQKALLDNIPHLAWLKDKQGRFTAVNKPFSTACGLESQEIIGKTDLDVWPIELARKYQADDCEIIKSGKRKFTEELIENRNGRRWFETFKSPVFNEDNEIIGTAGLARDITERLKSEKALRESEELFRTITETAQDSIFCKDLNLRYTFVNPAMEKLLGMPADKLIGKTAEEVFGKDAAEIIATVDKPVLKGKIVNEVRTLKIDTTPYILHTIQVPILNDKEIVGICGIVRDITQLKYAEKKLLETQTLLEKVFEKSPIPMVLASVPDNILRIVNPACKKILGLSDDDKYVGMSLLKIKQSWKDYQLDGTPVSVENLPLAKALRGIESRNVELMIERADGTIRYEIVDGVPIYNSDGKLTAGFIIFPDITERKKTERKVEHLNAVLTAIRHVNQLIVRENDPQKLIQSAVNNLIETRGFCGSWIVLFDHANRVVAKAESGLGKNFSTLLSLFNQGKLPYCAQTAVTTPNPFFICRDDQNCLDCPFYKDHSHNEKITMRLEHSGRIYGAITVYLPSNISADEKEVNLLEEIAEDIGFALYNLELEKEKEDIQRQFLQSQKMEAIGKLAGGIAHDFNNLLQAISLYAEMLLMDIDPRNPLYRKAEEIRKVTTRAANLTRQLLAFSRRQVLQLEAININTVFADILGMLERLIGEDIKLEVNIESDLKIIKADAGQIEQVIVNLIVNARDAMPDGGNLKISIANSFIDEFSCRFNPGAYPGEFVCLTISDTGVGMNETTKEQIFEPFFSTKGAIGGTGLGLSTVYGIVKQHHGWINVYSEIGQGTTFSIYIPVVPGEKSEADTSIPNNLLYGNGERILFIEDEEVIRAATVDMLMMRGYTVFPAENVMRAYEIFGQEKGKFDLILSDVVLPDGNGIDLVKNLTTIKPNLPVILSSGYTEQKSHLASIKEMDIEFLQKPYPLDGLLTIVKNLLGQQESMNEE